MAQTLDAAAHNIGVFDSPAVAADYSVEQTARYGDVGEQAALMAVASAVRGLPLLDVGVGGGRTTWSMLLISDDYVAIDAAPTMVALCRRSYPGIDVRLGDARDLREFADHSLGLVSFSNNGLDSLEHDDRAAVLAAFARVVRPDGLVLYSTHNLHGGSFGEKPWALRSPHDPTPRAWRPTVLGVARLAARPGRFATAVLSWRRHSRRTVVHDGWAMGPLRAHEFRLFTHFVDVRTILAELAAAGLAPVTIYSIEGRPVDPDGPETHTRYFHVVARPL